MRTVPSLLLLLAGASLGADRPLVRLEREMQRLSRDAGGVTGAAAIHIESGRTVSVNGSQRFPMASTYKLPIAIQTLTLVDQGRERLERLVAIEQRDLRPGSGTLRDLFNKPGVALSVRNLLELMMLISDNTATDILLRTAGGPAAVTSRLRSADITGITVSRPLALTFTAQVGEPTLADSDWSPAVVDRIQQKYLTIEGQPGSAAWRSGVERLGHDAQDTASPEAMASLLVRVHKRSLLKAETADLLLDIMRRCRTGEARLRGLLPPGTNVAHKTGSFFGSTNDVGIIELPDNAGHVALAVYVKESEKHYSARERVIAEIARAVHDFFLFQRAGD